MITGLGMVSPLGIGWRDAWRRRSPGAPRRADHALRHLGARLPHRLRGAGFDPEDFIDRRAARRMDRVSQFAVAAARMALEDADLEIEGDGERAGTVISTGNGSSEAFEENHRSLLERGAERSSPLMVPMTIVNMSAGHVSMQLGLRGPSSCVVTACASGNHGIGDAAAIIRRGAADVMVAGGTEAGVTAYCMASLDATRALSRRNDEPENASRPFDAGRDGFVSAEGAGVLVLESLEHAARPRRGHRLRAGRLRREQRRLPPHRPRPERALAGRGDEHGASPGGARPARGRLRQRARHLDARGRPGRDRRDPPARRRRARRRDGRRSTKSMHGHGMGAAGGFEAVLTALAIREGAIPPTINVDELDPACAGR